ncbi:hypothetical protein RFI_02949, partial [Reticulomyxa filosa]
VESELPNRYYCYSYYTIKRQYKYICSYTNAIKLECIVLYNWFIYKHDQMKFIYYFLVDNVFDESENKMNQESNIWIKNNNIIGDYKEDLKVVKELMGELNMIYYLFHMHKILKY